MAHPSRMDWEGSSLPYLEPVVPHSQIEDIIPLLLFAPFEQQLWGGGRRKGENHFSLFPFYSLNSFIILEKVLSFCFSSSHIWFLVRPLDSMNLGCPNTPVINTLVPTLQSILVHPSKLKGNQGTGKAKRHLYSIVTSVVFQLQFLIAQRSVKNKFVLPNPF